MRKPESILQGKEKMSRQRGVAMIIGIGISLILAVSAVTAVSMSIRQFEMVRLRGQRELAFMASEAGVRYALTRLAINDTQRLRNRNGQPSGQPNVPFQNRVQNDPNGLLISSDPNTPGLDHWEPALALRVVRDTNYTDLFHVTVVIRYDPQNTPPGRPFRISSTTRYLP